MLPKQKIHKEQPASILPTIERLVRYDWNIAEGVVQVRLKFGSKVLHEEKPWNTFKGKIHEKGICAKK